MGPGRDDGSPRRALHAALLEASRLSQRARNHERSRPKGRVAWLPSSRVGSMIGSGVEPAVVRPHVAPASRLS